MVRRVWSWGQGEVDGVVMRGRTMGADPGMRSVSHTLTVLRALTSCPDLDLVRLDRGIRLRGTAARHLIGSLVRGNCVSHGPSAGRCHVSLGVFRLKGGHIRGVSFLGITGDVVHRLSSSAERAIRLIIRSGSRILCVSGCNRSHNMQVRSGVNAGTPLCYATIKGTLLDAHRGTTIQRC